MTVTAADSGTEIIIRNNGEPPFEPITETGGLLSLRRAAEELGGAMTVGSFPEFLLTITLS